MRLAIAVLVASASVAEAGPLDGPFAELSQVKPADLIAVEAFAFDGGAYTHLAIGRFKRGGYTVAEARLMKCDDKNCYAGPMWHGATADGDKSTLSIEVVAVVDLAGAPAKLDGRVSGTSASATQLAVAKMKWPAVVVRATEHHPAKEMSRTGGEVGGTSTHGQLAILSLAPEDAKGGRVFGGPTIEIGASGAGMRASYALVAAAAKRPGGALDLVGTQQREIERTSRCLRPDPVPVNYVLADTDGVRAYRQVGIPEMTGCH